jgi:hypothetical protein
MASYFVLFSAPAAHIEFMRANHETARNYAAGEPPGTQDEDDEPHEMEVEQPRSFLATIRDWFLGRKPTVETIPIPPETLAERSQFSNPFAKTFTNVPSDWPKDHVETANVEINHRNVDLYHWILNNTSEPVDGAGSIFQTWTHPTHSAIHLDGINEEFAFLPNQVPDLLTLVDAVTPESTLQAFRGWCVAQGKDGEPSLDDATALHADFVTLSGYLKETIAKQHGLVWIS